MLGKLASNEKKVIINKENVLPQDSIFNYSFTSIDGIKKDMNTFNGKKIIIANTASDCGYTAQYAQLQKLQSLYPEKLVIIGFPANDFKQQEKGSNEDIMQFCESNYGVKFLLAQKSSVLKGQAQNNIFKWLSDKTLNGWCNTEPKWNFCKYLIDEKGMLYAFVPQFINPLDDGIIKWIEN